MIDFMIATLGSVTFWITYFVATIFIGTAVCKCLAPRTFIYITTGEDEDYDEVLKVFIAIVMYLFWPIVLVIGFIFKMIFCNLFVRAVKFADSNTPEIVFKKKED